MNMSNKKFNLIVEASPLPVVKAKGAKADEPIMLEGIFMEAAIKNGNGRTYSLNELTRAVEEFQPMIKENRALAELEHPDNTIIDPQRACARILSLTQSKENKNQFIGKAVVLSSIPSKNIHGTPCGDLLASLLQYGTKVGWSSRGVGEIDNDGTVSRFVDGVLESKEFVLKSHPNAQPIFEAIEKDLSNLSIDKSAKYEKINYALNRFFDSLKGVKS